MAFPVRLAAVRRTAVQARTDRTGSLVMIAAVYADSDCGLDVPASFRIVPHSHTDLGFTPATSAWVRGRHTPPSALVARV
jgi:hypothetical protein